METTKLINKIADRAKVTRTWLREWFGVEIDNIEEAETPEEREDATMYVLDLIDTEIRNLERLKSEILIAAAEVE